LFVESFLPEVEIATLELLERFDHEVVYQRHQTCGGQPMADNGFNARNPRSPILMNSSINSRRMHARTASMYWARDAAEHNPTVHGILKDPGTKTLIQEQIDAHRGMQLPPLYGVGRY
jgi:Fe-S oxidoreductase